jgi:hypothetical protein
MGRSVAVPSDAIATVYVDHGCEDPIDWDDWVEDVRNVIRSDYPSFSVDDRWVGQEERAILSNCRADVVVAEYCGLASISLVPTEESLAYLSEQNLHDAWCEQIEARWTERINAAFNGLRKVATFSNGESVYERVGS